MSVQVPETIIGFSIHDLKRILHELDIEKHELDVKRDHVARLIEERRHSLLSLNYERDQLPLRRTA